jgi:hypothetical protein
VGCGKISANPSQSSRPSISVRTLDGPTLPVEASKRKNGACGAEDRQRL